MSEQTWSARQTVTWKSKVGLAEMLKGGVIMESDQETLGLIKNSPNSQ